MDTTTDTTTRPASKVEALAKARALLAAYQAVHAVGRRLWNEVHAQVDAGANWEALEPERWAANLVAIGMERRAAEDLACHLTGRCVTLRSGYSGLVVDTGPGDFLGIETDSGRYIEAMAVDVVSIDA